MMPANPYQSIERGKPGTIGWRIHYFDEVGSTQRVAGDLAGEGVAQGTVVVAERQSAGRGRMGRTWHSPAGVNLYLTIILRPEVPIAEVPRLSLVAGVAAAEALESAAPGMVALKWPNDIWLNGRKTGGIIAEAVTDSRQGLRCVLLGIGLNVNLPADAIPPELRDKATSVRIATGRECDRIALAGTLFNRLGSRYMEIETLGFAAIRPVWEQYSALTGRRVTVVDAATRIAGVVQGIDNDGALLLQTDTGTARIVTGDVSIEGAYD
jgi:BirA family transcriptional regulator, biotin operon repressor / biotin---[acetyl-CoA-carboxylase] ligase